MCRIKRFTALAYTVARRDTDGYCTYLVGAVIVKGSRILATGTCSTKTDPKNPKLKSPTPRTQMCAEVAACLNALHFVESLKGCTIYVVRATKSGSQYMMARPCVHCQKFLAELHVRRAYYSNQEGKIDKLDLH